MVKARACARVLAKVRARAFASVAFARALARVLARVVARVMARVVARVMARVLARALAKVLLGRVSLDQTRHIMSPGPSGQLTLRRFGLATATPQETAGRVTQKKVHHPAEKALGVPTRQPCLLTASDPEQE